MAVKKEIINHDADLKSDIIKSDLEFFCRVSPLQTHCSKRNLLELSVSLKKVRTYDWREFTENFAQ